ncbi:zinc finger protein-domain-containing protein [Penicillium cinerascens]|uniref:Zinc finger protein-domain-containing protein n=1 Tax=Penicillium cinerascens TaxID=70096 RepID=A0A9W9J5R9_9EURO|nr:zinc finger protein-domain-containing protein [Penicillium cinerascens]KAJ5190593.1 zinc finger protein-domain-containing protein [Penicillium cinerascens]
MESEDGEIALCVDDGGVGPRLLGLGFSHGSQNLVSNGGMRTPILPKCLQDNPPSNHSSRHRAYSTSPENCSTSTHLPILPCQPPNRRQLNPTNRECLTRLYLGSRRTQPELPSPNFTLRNFNLHLDQMLEVNPPALFYAGAMGEALAIIHWAAHVDGFDIEFVLGSEGDSGTSYTKDIFLSLDLTPDQISCICSSKDLDAAIRINFEHRTTRMWVLDFNLCHIWNEEIAWENPVGFISHLVYTCEDTST